MLRLRRTCTGLRHIGVIASPATANTTVQTGAIPTRAGVIGVAARDECSWNFPRPWELLG